MRVALLTLALPLAQAVPQHLPTRDLETRDVRNPSWDGPKPNRAWDGPSPNPADDGPSPNPAWDGPEPNPADDGPEPNPEWDGPGRGTRSNQIKPNQNPRPKPQPAANPKPQPKSGPMTYDDMMAALVEMGMDSTQRSQIEELLRSTKDSSTFELTMDTPPEAQDSANPESPPTVNIQQKPKEEKPKEEKPKANQEAPKPKQPAPPKPAPPKPKQPAPPPPPPAQPKAKNVQKPKAPTSPKPSPNKSRGPDIKDLALEKHNSYRSKHNAGPLEWDDYLADEAMAWIMQLEQCILRHPQMGEKEYGQNLASASFTWAPTEQEFLDNTANGIDGWYDEVKIHDFSSNSFIYATGHFTQLVWKGSKRLGCATRFCDGAKGETREGPAFNATVTACHYYPPGNMGGEFLQNVSP
ncbi:hypothetical protein CDD82_290 [Ophiocordyceps australis]|uniref:SCP domain-containing protein n=1 Tax=Ophiocordyceps australis TaxID=1399860 RepID=A0A2C5YN91_9HYPO|nr:hypothetical protein CDD82_290 [Ophiocordyceps australis]